jgi:hypothetical protein
MNEKKIFKKNKFWSTKTNLLFYSTLIQQVNIINDPIIQLISNYQDILAFNEKKDINAEDYIKFLYFNRIKIEKIIYDKDEFIEINPNNIIKDLSYYFYLDLLISHNSDMVNYIYSIDLINIINKQQESIDKKEIFKKILFAKIIIELIINYKGIEKIYNEDKDNKILERIEKENKEIIKDTVNIFSNLNLNWTLDSIMTKNIDQIYIEIIISLIKNDLLNEKIFKIDIINQLNLEKIEITKTMIDELSKALNSNINYNITAFDDLFNDKKIIFFYILFKYILKEPLYIFQIDFLIKTRNNIKIIIKNDINRFLEYFHKKNENIKEKINYILEFMLENYYLKIINNCILKFNSGGEFEVKKQENSSLYNYLINDNSNVISDNNNCIINSSISSSNYMKSSEKKYNINSNFSNNSNMSYTFSRKMASDSNSNSNRGIINYEELSKNEQLEIEEMKDILEYSTFKFHTDRDKNIEYDEIKFGKELKTKNFEEIEQKRLNEQINICKNYKKFLSFIFWFKDIIKKSFINNFKLEGKLEFKIEKDQDNNNNDLYDTECIYYFKQPNDNNIIKNYHDEKCLFTYKKDTNLLEGFNNFLNEINQDDYKNIDYCE